MLPLWISLTAHRNNDDRRYFVQVSSISYFMKHTEGGSVVCFVGDNDDFIHVAEDTSDIWRLVHRQTNKRTGTDDLK